MKQLLVCPPDRQPPAAPRPVGRRPTADATYQPLPFTQDWANTGLITTNDDWAGVPGIMGFRGDNLTTTTGVDPQRSWLTTRRAWWISSPTRPTQA